MDPTLHLRAGQALAVTARSTNPADPPPSVTWKPAAGPTRVTVTLTNPAGESISHTFSVQAG